MVGVLAKAGFFEIKHSPTFVLFKQGSGFKNESHTGRARGTM